jgi:hypothetical protein
MVVCPPSCVPTAIHFIPRPALVSECTDWFMKKGCGCVRFLASTCLIVFFMLACSFVSPLLSTPRFPPLPSTPTTSDRPTGSSPFSGDWNAKTPFGSLAFTVDPDGSIVTTALVRLTGFSCNETSLTTEAQALSRWALQNGEFSGRISLSSYETSDIYLDGSFNSAARTFSGTWELNANGALCSGEWETAPHQ